MPHTRRSSLVGVVLALVLAAPVAAEAPRLGAVAINVSDLKRAADFYVAALDLKQAGAHETPAFTEVFLSSADDEAGASLVLVQSKSAPVDTSAVRLIFFVDSAADALAELEAAGATEIRTPSPAGNMLIAFARDPDGHLVEVIEYVNPAN